MEFINLKKQYEVLKPIIDSSVAKIMTEARFIGGSEIAELETKLANYVGRKHCITCGNGTDALELSYLAYGITKNDAVFCPDMTFIASIEPACMLGATPIFCDIDPKTYNINPIDLENEILRVIEDGKLVPKIVVAVDFLGFSADFDEIIKICKKYNLILIEDAAQSMGAVYKGKKCGSFGDISCTSFFPSKPLGCYGDGGAIFTDDDNIAKLIRSYKVHGKGLSKYDNVRVGINSRLDTIQAAVLLAKFEIFEKEIIMRQKIALNYNLAFNNMLQTPFVFPNCRSSYAQYVLLAPNVSIRTKIINALHAEGIPSLLYYPKPMHSMKVFNLYFKRDFEYSDLYANCNFGIPFSPYITLDEQELVINIIKSVL